MVCPTANKQTKIISFRDRQTDRQAGQEFDGDQGGGYGRVWREKRKERNVIKL